MKNFINAMKMAENHVSSTDCLPHKENEVFCLSIDKAYETLDKLVKESWHVWTTAENYRETLKKALEISEEIEKVGIANYRSYPYHVDLYESSEGFQYSLYKWEAEPDEDGAFDEDLLVDGGIIECDTLSYALYYINSTIVE